MQVKYSESGVREKAREEAAAKREGGVVMGQPCAVIPGLFPWHCLSPGARFTAAVCGSSAPIQQ